MSIGRTFRASRLSVADWLRNRAATTVDGDWLPVRSRQARGVVATVAAAAGAGDIVRYESAACAGWSPASNSGCKLCCQFRSRNWQQSQRLRQGALVMVVASVPSGSIWRQVGERLPAYQRSTAVACCSRLQSAQTTGAEPMS